MYDPGPTLGRGEWNTTTGTYCFTSYYSIIDSDPPKYTLSFATYSMSYSEVSLQGSYFSGPLYLNP